MNSEVELNRRRHVLEGILSDSWQHYCLFVRKLLIWSSTGCITAEGIKFPPSITPATAERASYISIKAAARTKIISEGSNSILKKEPTWGDIDKISSIIAELKPGNSEMLNKYFQGGLLGPKHMQIVRNACAHKNHQTKAEVQNLAPSYIASTINHPIESMTWREPESKDFAFISWLDDIKTIAVCAVD